jgi:hypothetical protein
MNPGIDVHAGVIRFREAQNFAAQFAAFGRRESVFYRSAILHFRYAVLMTLILRNSETGQP